MKLQILDADYQIINNKPVVRIFGKSEEGKTYCVFDDSFLPYFYCRPKDSTDRESFVEDLKDVYGGGLRDVEVVERYDPIGYDPEPKEMLKIVLDNPRRVPEVSEYVQEHDSIRQIYEADILYKYRYLVDHDLGGMHWMEVEGKNNHTDTVKCNSFDADKIEKIDREDNVEFRYLSFDIECLPQEEGRMVDADKDPVILISCSFYPKFKGKRDMVLVAKSGDTEEGVHFNSEEEMLERFVDIIDEFDPDIITGYNHKSFDIPYILDRLDKYDIRKDLGRCERPVYYNRYGNNTDIKMVGRVVVDPYNIIKGDPYMRLMRYDLNTVGEELLGESKVDVEYSEMRDLWEGDSSDLEKFVEYARKDSEIPLRLLTEKGLLDKFFELAKVCGLLLKDSMGGQTQRISNRLLREFKERDYVLPVKPSDEELERRNERRKEEALKGGLVLEPNVGLHTDSCVSVLDFKSLYPSVMSTYNICPTTLVMGDDVDEDKIDYESPTGENYVSKDVRKGVLADIVEDLIDARSEVKKEMRAAEDSEVEDQLDAKQLALKVMTNSFYGYTGYYRTRLYRLAIANSITSYGRKVIEDTEEICKEDFDVKVTYGDTDSVMVKTGTTDLDKSHEVSQEISEYVTDTLPGRLILEPEKIYRSFLILTKKRYAGWCFEKDGDDWDEKIDMKGIETVRRDWANVVTDTMQNVLEIILMEGNIDKAVEHVQQTVMDIKKGEVDMEDLTVVKSLTKKPEAYDGAVPHVELAKKMKERNPSDPPSTGDRIPYVVIKGNRIISKRAEHPDYIEENGLKIDSDYYIHKQLLPPIERIFNVIGVDKQELLGEGRLAGFDEFIQNNDIDRNRDVSIEKDPKDKVIENPSGFACDDCDKEYRRVPLRGKCDCGGEIFCVGDGSIGKKVKIDVG